MYFSVRKPYHPCCAMPQYLLIILLLSVFIALLGIGIIVP